MYFLLQFLLYSRHSITFFFKLHSPSSYWEYVLYRTKKAALCVDVRYFCSSACPFICLLVPWTSSSSSIGATARCGLWPVEQYLSIFSYHQLSPSSHSQHLKISFYFFSPSFPGSSSSSRPFQFLREDLSRWPSQLVLCKFIHFTIFSFLLNSSSLPFVLLLPSPSSYLRPYILLNIFLSKVSTAFSSFFVIVHVSPPYVTTGLISVLYSRILVALDKSLFLKRIIAAK